jgi:phosphohistidine phosphatase
MKRVVIVRHGKAVPYGYEDDYSRDLTDRGKKDAGNISSELYKRGVIPDEIISSPAKRAIKTARIFADNLDFSKSKIQEVEAIYDGLTTSEFLEIIRELPENINSVFFFGHNPGFHYFAGNLLKDSLGEMPTCSTVGIEFNVNTWQEIEARSGKKAFHFIPKMFS